MNIVPDESVHLSLADQNREKLMMEINNLKAENYKLRTSLQESESLWREIENKMNHNATSDRVNDGLESIMNMLWTRALKVQDEQVCLIV